MSDSVSSTRLYLGNLPRDVTKEEITQHFQDGPGTINEIKIMNGFGFLEYEDAADARDVVPHFHGSDFKGNRLTVQFARGSRPRDYPAPERPRPPRPRRTAFRMQITGLPVETSWQDLKDFARRSGLDVVYSEIGRERDGRGFVEFETGPDLKVAVDKLDNQDFKGTSVRCISDIQEEVPGRQDSRYRSRSPPSFRGRGGYPPNGGYDYDRRPPPPRGYSPRREEYRRRSPPPRDDYYGRHGSYRSPPRGPPRGAPPMDDGYGAPRGGYGREPDPYSAPPRRGAYDDPYARNGDYPPPRRSPPPPRGYGGGYGDERQSRGYW
ncbi:uncharacterized protein KY384_000727 [Bacidia gigantensis]|uniref:uncharacterized protein n=1 Tax=Bacidia gigantensis TaxID=2732470 RepID=UPI001D057F9F|nr:uncharacterized protein KY384_000727 [Bacidia gigantensis]KAG8525965.1 hypothetical protein KY384_000727 [Bacidia gigantensis]